MSAHTRPWFVLAPVLFVVLWSTGFIGAKFGLPYAEPFTFLLWRFALVTLLMLAIALALRAPWPGSVRAAAHIAVAGLFVHAGYLGGVFGAMHRGVSAGEMALIAGLQPALTAAGASLWLRERVSPRQWFGIAIAFPGVLLVVQERFVPGATAGGYGLAVFALVCITLGTLYQKRFCSHMDLRSGSVIQFAASSVLMALVAPVFETMTVRWSGEFVFALAWLVLVLSVGAITLLYLMIRHGEASRVTSMFYLVPPVTALMAWALFGERLAGMALVGMVLVIAGVALVVVPRRDGRTGKRP